MYLSAAMIPLIKTNSYETLGIGIMRSFLVPIANAVSANVFHNLLGLQSGM